jgi:hypothetical protein
MSNRVAAVVLLVLSLAFLGAGLIHAQAAKKEEPKAEDKKEEEKKEGDKEEEKKEEIKPLTQKEMHDTMEAVEKAWNKLKIHARNKMGDKAAAAADEIAKLSADLLRYDGNMLEPENKEKKARDQQDYKDWVAALIKAAEEYSKHAKKSAWDKADKEKDKINETCGDCHEKYEPVKKD